MMLLRPLALFTSLVLSASTTVCAQASPSSEEAAVRTVVNTYLHGLKFNDVPSLQRAFWPEAKLFFRNKDGHLGQLSQEGWYKGFAGVAGQEEKGDLRIASLEITYSGEIAELDTAPVRSAIVKGILSLASRSSMSPSTWHW